MRVLARLQGVMRGISIKGIMAFSEGFAIG
jgi:hypothetical protein